MDVVQLSILWQFIDVCLDLSDLPSKRQYSGIEIPHSFKNSCIFVEALQFGINLRRVASLYCIPRKITEFYDVKLNQLSNRLFKGGINLRRLTLSKNPRVNIWTWFK